MDESNHKPPKALVKIALYGFIFVLLAIMLFLKPYLPSAVFYNFADIDDYQKFANRVVKAAPVAQPWSSNEVKHPEPDSDTAQLLSELDTTALLMLDQGKLSYERYSLTGAVDELSGSFSVAKSVLALLVGFALQDGSIGSLDEPIEKYFPNWNGSPQGKITIRQLLTMSSGLNWNESYSNPFAIAAEAYYGSDLFLTTLKQNIIHTPGSLFSYQSGTSQLLGFILSSATHKTISQYASEKLWAPLGAEKDALWSLDRQEGIEKAFCCLSATARDFARIGQFVLQNGMWNGKQLLNQQYISEMLTPHGILNQRGKPTDYYGYHWWIYKTPEGDIPYARGILGQYIIVIPQKQRVVVRLGLKRGKTIEHHPEEVRALVQWAMQN